MDHHILFLEDFDDLDGNAKQVQIANIITHVQVEKDHIETIIENPALCMMPDKKKPFVNQGVRNLDLKESWLPVIDEFETFLNEADEQLIRSFNSIIEKLVA